MGELSKLPNIGKEVEMRKYIPNGITGMRIAGSLALIFLRPLSSSFFVLYVLCGLSDMFDGFIARKTNTASAEGAVLDSIADAVFLGIMLFILAPILPYEPWMLLWIMGIGGIRLLSWFIGFIKFRTFASLHTYANKATGFVLFCSPILCILWGMPITVAGICILASLSALEELAITITSRKLLRNTVSLFNRPLLNKLTGKNNSPAC